MPTPLQFYSVPKHNVLSAPYGSVKVKGNYQIHVHVLCRRSKVASGLLSSACQDRRSKVVLAVQKGPLLWSPMALTARLPRHITQGASGEARGASLSKYVVESRRGPELGQDSRRQCDPTRRQITYCVGSRCGLRSHNTVGHSHFLSGRDSRQSSSHVVVVESNKFLADMYVVVSSICIRDPALFHEVFYMVFHYHATPHGSRMGRSARFSCVTRHAYLCSCWLHE